MHKTMIGLGAVMMLFCVALVASWTNRPSQLPDQVAPKQATQPNVAAECSAAAVTLENGRKQYPISVKYDHLPWLGQLFTADECGSERLEEVAKGGYYSRGSKLWLKSAPSQGLFEALTAVGYHCEGESGDAACVVWRLDSPVAVSKILKLKPFAQEIETDDCVNCG